MIQSSHSTPQLFINGRIISAKNFDTNEMYLKVYISDNKVGTNIWKQHSKN